MSNMYAQLALPEFEHEMATTRKLLERIPEDKLDWTMDDRSHTLAWNGSHIAEIPGWAPNILTEPFFDMNPGGQSPYSTEVFKGLNALLGHFDENVKAATLAIGSLKDESLADNWQFRDNGTVLFEMPRVAAFRTWVISHGIHHRAILSVYFRQLGVPVPAIYGPSSDEAPQ